MEMGLGGMPPSGMVVVMSEGLSSPEITIANDREDDGTPFIEELSSSPDELTN